MTKDHISTQKFLEELRRYQKGSVTRRHFLGVTGLGLATAVMSSAVPGLRPRKAYAELSGTVNFTTWPSYFAQENLDNFTKNTGVKINVAVFGSNEEMLAKLQAGSTGWDVFVPTNYAISTYKDLGLIEPLDLKRLPNYDPSTQEQRFTAEGSIDGVVYAVPKDSASSTIPRPCRRSPRAGRSSGIWCRTRRRAAPWCMTTSSPPSAMR